MSTAKSIICSFFEHNLLKAREGEREKIKADRVNCPKNSVLLVKSIHNKQTRPCFDVETHIFFVCGYFELCLVSFSF